MITVRAPGKLFIAGEYAVVEPGQPAVIIAIDRYLAVTLTESVDVGTVHSPEYGQLPLVWRRSGDDVTIDRDHHPYDYVMSAITTVERVRARRGVAPKFFDTRIDSQLDDVSGRKFGIGSSAAVTVATVRAMSELYGLGLSNLEVFKLALLATVQIAPAASGGDLAASCFGGWIRYSAPDRARLIDELSHRDPADLNAHKKRHIMGGKQHSGYHEAQQFACIETVPGYLAFFYAHQGKGSHGKTSSAAHEH